MVANNNIQKASIGTSGYNRDGGALITTIIPTYRRPKLLRRAITSVLNQTYTHFQVCVYDNASGDETASVVADFAKKDSRVKYHCHPENIGALKNFNYGMKQVTTPYFSFLSDDDLLLPTFYQLAIEKLSAYTDTAFFAGSTIHVDSSGSPLIMPLSGWKEGLYLPPDGLLNMWEKAHPTWTGILIRSQLLDQVGELDLGLFSDLDFELRIARYYSFYVSLEPVAILSVNDNTASHHRNLNDVWPAIKILGERYFTDAELDLQVRERIYLSWWKKAQSALLGIAANSLIFKRPSQALDAVQLCIDNFGPSPKSSQLLILSKAAIFNKIIAIIVAKMLEFRRIVNLKLKSAKIKKTVQFRIPGCETT